MDWVLQIAGTVGIAVSLGLTVQAKRELRHTTLTTAQRWATAAVALWAVAWGTTVLSSSLTAGIADQFWYATAVTSLCPFVAVLGAKRPGARVWNWFVLIPLLLVMEWPAVVTLRDIQPEESLLLETPTIVGFALVAVMGTGNYLGTRFSLAAVLVFAALLLLVVPLGDSVSNDLADRVTNRRWATVCFSAGIVSAALAGRQRSTVVLPEDRAWIDFRNGFGIVWAKRIQDRVNDSATKENWPAELTTQGLAWKDRDVDSAARERTLERYQHTLRWLLRRFVDVEWLDRRFGKNGLETPTSEPKLNA